MPSQMIDNPQRHQAFLSSSRPHLLMLTIHGIHQWEVLPGLPDTGGQNVFVNQFSQALADEGFKITIVNRGGYAHPLTGKLRVGTHYKDDYQRILYLQDGLDHFVRKEDMGDRISNLVASLLVELQADLAPVDLIISHYWDAGSVAESYRQYLSQGVKHIWVPHSLGIIKKSNLPQDQWVGLKIDYRIAHETNLVNTVDGIGSTSPLIQRSLHEDYGYSGPLYWLPPCVDTDRFHPREIPDDHPIWSFLSQHTQLSAAQIRECKIVTEISRTDLTKRKNILIEAFARVHQKFHKTLLVIAVDPSQVELSQNLRALIKSYQLESHVAQVGSIREELPALYAVTNIYCTPSIMEGFGMSAQEAAATGVPVVASSKVPFVDQYLQGESITEIPSLENGERTIRVGQGSIIVPADEIQGFVFALDYLLADEPLRKDMGQRAYDLTIPRFTWKRLVGDFLEQLNWKRG